MNCPACNAENRLEARYCFACGVSIAATVEADNSVVCDSKLEWQECPSGSVDSGRGMQSQQPGSGRAILGVASLAVGGCLSIGVLGAIGLVGVFLVRSHGEQPDATRPASIARQPDTRASGVTTEKAKNAIMTMLGSYRIGGDVNVLGVAEESGGSAATADIRFDRFRYWWNSGGLMTPDEVRAWNQRFEEQLRSGMIPMGLGDKPKEHEANSRGVAVFKHYNDGRWVLVSVAWDGNRVSGSVDVP